MDPPDPFQSRFGPAGPHRAAEGAPPAPDVSDQPRLGILHLLVWTACTAAYMEIQRAMVVAGPVQHSMRATTIVQLVISGIGGGTAWGGVLLWVARRRRRIPFPVHPGERFLVVVGLNTILGVLGILSYTLLYNWPAREWSSPWGILGLLGFAVTILACIVICLAALRREKLRIWKYVFLLLATQYVILCGRVGPWSPLSGISLGLDNLPNAILAALLAVIALGDLRHRRRYPWSHWTGVALGLWFGAAALAEIAWMALGGRP